jgi:hypothetical protein
MLSTGVNSLSLPGSDSVEDLHAVYNTIVIIRVPSIYQLGKMDQNDQKYSGYLAIVSSPWWSLAFSGAGGGGGSLGSALP